MANNEVAVKEQGFISDVSPDRWNMMLSQAETIVKAKLCPVADTKETVVIKILAGREYGLSAMQSLRALYVVGQKVAMMSDTVAGLVFQRLPGAKIDCIETTDKIATFKASRPGGEPVTLSFTMEDAKRAGLGGTSWQKYPAQMLRARCQIGICRLVFPDVCAGLYTPDELGDKTLPATDVPIAEQLAKENERIAKKELKDAGLIKEAEEVHTEAKEVSGDTAPLPEGEKPASAPAENVETPPESMSEAQKQDNIIQMGILMYPNEAARSAYFIKSSEYIWKEEGKPDKFVKGKDDPYKLKAGRLINTYNRVKRDYDKWEQVQK